MEITSKTELEKIISENENALIALRFHADWCAPCRLLGQVINEINIDNVIFVGVNVDDADEAFVNECNVRNIPTVLFYKNGLLVDRFTGMIGKDAILTKIKENLEK